MHPRKPVIFLISFFFAAAALAQSAGDPESRSTALVDLQPGVVVEKVGKNSEAERAGLREGDVILRWTHGDVKGDIESPFDLVTLETETAPLGPLILEGTRAAQKQTWILGPDTWGFDSCANFSSELLAIYRQAQDPDAADKRAQLTLRERRLPWVPAWLFFQRARQLDQAKQWTEADKAFEESIQEASQAGPKVLVIVLSTWARAFLDRGDSKDAEKYYQRALVE